MRGTGLISSRLTPWEGLRAYLRSQACGGLDVEDGSGAHAIGSVIRRPRSLPSNGLLCAPGQQYSGRGGPGRPMAVRFGVHYMVFCFVKHRPNRNSRCKERSVAGMFGRRFLKINLDLTGRGPHSATGGVTTESRRELEALCSRDIRKQLVVSSSSPATKPVSSVALISSRNICCWASCARTRRWRIDSCIRTPL